MTRYTHTHIEQLAEAINSVPEFEQQPAAKTGIDDATADLIGSQNDITNDTKRMVLDGKPTILIKNKTTGFYTKNSV